MPAERSPLMREALRWFAIMRDDEVTDEDRRAFESWMQQGDEHRAAWERATSLWSALAPVEVEFRNRRRRTLSRRAFVCAGLGLLVAGPAGYRLYRNGMLADFTTASGERRDLTLADGSTVEMGSRSALSIDYSQAWRRLVLHRGEAYFTVAADQRRPFIVTSSGGETRALGTRFNIHTDDDLVTITVAEHEVDVSLEGGPASRIGAGWQLAYAPDRMLAPVEVDLQSVEAWRSGRLVYHGAPLRRVLHDIERYRGGYVVLLDQQIGDLPVSAAFNTASADAALDSIAQTLPIRVRRAGGIAIVSSI